MNNHWLFNHYNKEKKQFYTWNYISSMSWWVPRCECRKRSPGVDEGPIRWTNACGDGKCTWRWPWKTPTDASHHWTRHFAEGLRTFPPDPKRMNDLGQLLLPDGSWSCADGRHSNRWRKFAQFPQAGLLLLAIRLQTGISGCSQWSSKWRWRQK